MTDPTTLTRRSFVIMPLALAACGTGSGVLSLSGSTMGTSYTVVARDATRRLDERDVQAAIDDTPPERAAA